MNLCHTQNKFTSLSNQFIFLSLPFAHTEIYYATDNEFRY
jgi:hypothetical protein